MNVYTIKKNLIFTMFLTCSSIADPVISMFYKPYPIADDPAYTAKVSENLKNPGKIAHYTFHNTLNPDLITGIFSTYGGYISASNSNGQTLFPLRHSQPLLYILVAQAIVPIMMGGNTIHHWEIAPNSAASMVKLERKQDEATHLLYWDCQPLALPENNHVPLESIVIFGKPKNFYIPTGITLTDNGTNYTLPSIYVKKGIKIVPTTLYLLNMKPFFGPVNFLFDKRESGYSQHIDN